LLGRKRDYLGQYHRFKDSHPKVWYPYSYYVDSYSVYRFVQGRDSNWRSHYQLTDEADPQWKQVLDDCGVKVKYALSPQAKER